MKRISPGVAAFLQAAGIVAYVALFALIAQTVGAGFRNVGPIASITLMLLVFIFSAVVCASLMFGYPLFLFLAGEKKQAVRIVATSVVWLALFIVLAFALVASLG